MSKKILIISRAFPPAGGGGVQRIVKFAIYLDGLGWDVTVCTIEGANYSWKDEARLKEIKNVKVVRVKETAYNPTFFNKIINRLNFHDFYNNWANEVISYYINKDKFDYDYVLTSGPPHSVHNIGIKLKKKFNFLWISDFRDPLYFIESRNAPTFLHKRFLKKYELKIYQNSDLIITNTEINRKEVVEFFKLSENKIKSIYNGYDFHDLKLTGESPNFDNSKINLLYLGGLRGDKIDKYFYEVFKMALDLKPKLIDKVRVHLIGDLSRKGDMIEQLKIGKYFLFHNILPYNRVGDYIKASDGCLTWQNPNKGYKGTIAGKVFDYFGMEKPIFSIGQQESELDFLINRKRIGIHTNVNDSENSTQDFIEFLINIKEYENNYKNIDEIFYDSFNRKTQVKYLNNLILDIKN